MVPPNLNYWSNPSEESPESQQKHPLENRFLRTILCSDDNFNPGYNQKMLIGKKTSNLDGVCFTFGNLFCPVQCTACKTCQFSSLDKVVISRVTSFPSISDHTCSF